MTFNLDDANVGGQLKIGTGICPATGEGPSKINGSAMIEGPAVFGTPTLFPFPYATVNIGPLTNEDSPGPIVPGDCVMASVIHILWQCLGTLLYLESKMLMEISELVETYWFKVM